MGYYYLIEMKSIQHKIHRFKWILWWLSPFTVHATSWTVTFCRARTLILAPGATSLSHSAGDYAEVGHASDTPSRQGQSKSPAGCPSTCEERHQVHLRRPHPPAGPGLKRSQAFWHLRATFAPRLLQSIEHQEKFQKGPSRPREGEERKCCRPSLVDNDILGEPGRGRGSQGPVPGAAGVQHCLLPRALLSICWRGAELGGGTEMTPWPLHSTHYHSHK